MFKVIQGKVDTFRSFKPRRTKGLDLSYIPFANGMAFSRIIAMCAPSTGGLKAIVRNNIQQVSDFLHEHHGPNFKIFNLTECPHAENAIQAFQPAKHYHIPIPDHNVPRFEQILEFCLEADEFLRQDPDNVIVVHCKAGKGRTGVMIVCYLLFSGACQTPDDALDVFAVNRSAPKDTVTIDGKETEVGHRGVDQASQLRWVRDFFKVWKTVYDQVEQNTIKDHHSRMSIQLDRMSFDHLNTIERRLRFVTMTGKPYTGDCIQMILRNWGLVRDGGGEVVKLVNMEKVAGRKEIYMFDFRNVITKAESKIELVVDSKVVCRFWFHPALIEGNILALTKDKIDDAWKDTEHKVFPSNFHVELSFLQYNELTDEKTQAYKGHAF